MRTKSKKGISLVELMVAVATSAFLILAAGMILTFGQKSWNNEWKRACLQREAAQLMLEMTHPIKAAVAATDNPSSHSINIYNNDGDVIQFSFISAQNILQKKINGGSDIDISDKVQNLTFDVNDSKVTIDLAMEADGIQTQFVSTVMMRNYGG